MKDILNDRICKAVLFTVEVRMGYIAQKDIGVPLILQF